MKLLRTRDNPEYKYTLAFLGVLPGCTALLCHACTAAYRAAVYCVLCCPATALPSSRLQSSGSFFTRPCFNP